ncbi:MAG: hypothetical protein AABX89_05340 [Candidatus Thermoplasmatota archaeon]
MVEPKPSAPVAAFVAREVFNETYTMNPTTSPSAVTVTVPEGGNQLLANVTISNTAPAYLVNQELDAQGQFKDALTMTAPSGKTTVIDGAASGPIAATNGVTRHLSQGVEFEAGEWTFAFSLIGTNAEVRVTFFVANSTVG